MLPLLSLLTAPSAVHAAAYDPALEWRTLRTEHFEITFHQGEEQLANELGHSAEAIYAELTADMDWTPKAPTRIVLVDHTDVANGYATTVPYNAIVIFVTAPEAASGLSLYEDWSSMIFTHEYAHILHLDNVQGGPALLRHVLGRIISVNQLSPWWIVEGSATYQESRHSTGGRGYLDNPNSDMVIRTALLEGTFPSLDQMDGFMSGPPGGNTRYVFGQSFLSYVADNSSDDAITRWNSSYGGWWLPYLLPAERVFGQSWTALYDGWVAELSARYAEQQAQVQAGPQGLQGTPITQVDGSCYGATFSPDGEKLLYACSERTVGSNIFLAKADGSDPQIEVPEGFAKTFTWRPDSQAFAWSANHVVDDFNLYNDVYFHALDTESTTRLTDGQRARDPAFSPDGSQLLLVKNQAQNNNLGRMHIDQSVTQLTDYSDHTQLGTPRWSPDGRFIALSVWQDGQRDLWIFDALGQPYRRVTADIHTDRDPAWSADGRTLYFASDRSGISNLYAIDLESERLYQLTNVLSGAFQPEPHPDGTQLIWQQFHAQGYQLVLADLDRDAWVDRGLLPLDLDHAGDLSEIVRPQGGGEDPQPPQIPAHLPSTDSGFTGASTAPPSEVTGSLSNPAPSRHAVGSDQPTRGADQDDFTRVRDDKGEQDRDYPFDFPVQDYRPGSTLFPPRYLMPSLYSTGIGVAGSLSTAGRDQLNRHIWGASLSYRSDANFIGGGATYIYNRWRPVISLSASHSAVPYGAIYRLPDGDAGVGIPTVEPTDQRYWDKRTRFGAGVTYSRRQRTNLYLRYSGVLRRPLETLPSGVYEPFLPTRGFLSTVSGGWRYYRGRAYSYSISPEDSRYLALDANFTTSLLGSFTYEDGKTSPFNRVQLMGEAREYVALPWADNHVLALRAAGGIAIGDQLNQGSFILGGSFGESPWVATPAEWQALRGYALGADRGDGYYLGSLEYRAPLWRIDRGWRTAPIFLRTLHGAAFVDVGDAFYTADTLEVPRVGVGAELRLGMLAGWGLGFNSRVGYAVGLTGTGAFGPVDAGSVYFRLGTSF
ncbi:MAG: hypothetical protein VX899_15050 [Myxococcota bacterium]|nr:hypothetical protein [Myxococcota bacterium]